MKIRNYVDADFANVEQLLKATGLHNAPFDTKLNLKKKIKHDPESIMVAEENGKIIGCVYIIYDPWSSFVYHLGVHPNHQRKGIGSKLMDVAESRLKSRGCKIPTLFVEESNKKVMEMYKKRGWYIDSKTFCMEKKL